MAADLARGEWRAPELDEEGLRLDLERHDVVFATLTAGPSYVPGIAETRGQIPADPPDLFRRERAMTIFDLHSRVLTDYRDFVRSCITIADEPIRDFVDQSLDHEARLWPDSLIQVSSS